MKVNSLRDAVAFLAVFAVLLAAPALVGELRPS
jgi:hypothetical protein